MQPEPRSLAQPPSEVAGREDFSYDRHLLLDKAADPRGATARDQFEACARSVRDTLAQRWASTAETYARRNPKTVYYLSMEFLIGRSLANNVTNLLLDGLAQTTASRKNLDWLALLDQEPDPGLGNGGLGRLAACFLDSMATLQLPAMGYGLRYEYGMFRQSIRDGWQREQPDNWLRRADPWEIARPDDCVEVAFGCSFVMRNGNLELIPDRPSTLVGVPFDRPVVGYGGKTVNTLRLWSAVAPDDFDFQQFSAGEFVGALTNRWWRSR
jgi:starch phosphorylase